MLILLPPNWRINMNYIGTYPQPLFTVYVNICLFLQLANVFKLHLLLYAPTTLKIERLYVRYIRKRSNNCLPIT